MQTKAAPHTHTHTQTLTRMLREGANRPAYQTAEDSVDASLPTLTFCVAITTNLLPDLNMGKRTVQIESRNPPGVRQDEPRNKLFRCSLFSCMILAFCYI